MNIFLPSLNFKECAEILDDKRLNKQILECKQILSMILKKKEDASYNSPYLHHPVVINYFNQEHHVVEYALAMCKEFNYRFNKQHSLRLWFISHTTPARSDFEPIYAQGSKNAIDCIREKRPDWIIALFQARLTQKWNSDLLNGRPPKWTNRKRPNFGGEN